MELAHAGFESETRGRRRGSRVAGIADAGIADAEVADAGVADAEFASHRCHKREVCVQVRTRGERGRGCGFCVTLTQEEHRRGNRLRVVSIQECADCV